MYVTYKTVFNTAPSLLQTSNASNQNASHNICKQGGDQKTIKSILCSREVTYTSETSIISLNLRKKLDVFCVRGSCLYENA